MSSLKSFKLGLDSILRPLAGHQADISHLSPTRLIPLLAERILLELPILGNLCNKHLHLTPQNHLLMVLRKSWKRKGSEREVFNNLLYLTVQQTKYLSGSDCEFFSL